MANTTETVAAIISILRVSKVDCDLFGGWAEELLGLCSQREHGDIDLLYRAESFAALDVAISEIDLAQVMTKRFRHKRAFIFRDTLCEITLVQDWQTAPVTHYWGDVPFHWHLPLVEPRLIVLHDTSISLVSAINLRKHRAARKSLQPHRWQDPASIERR